MADVAQTLLAGKVRVAEDVFGWGRATVELGLKELRTGVVCVNDLSRPEDDLQHFEPPWLQTADRGQDPGPKKTPWTDAIFANVRLVNSEVNADKGTLRISMDTKATVNWGDYSRGGQSRALEPVAALDHNMDNGPECSAHRSQFLHRMVVFADATGLEIRWVYYPPYHSKYNPIEHYWGGLERYIGSMTVLWVGILDDPGPQSERAYVERSAIALLSNRVAPIDPPSEGWLGRFSPREEIRRSGLWNLKHVEQGYDALFLDKLEALVLATCAQANAAKPAETAGGGSRSP